MAVRVASGLLAKGQIAALLDKVFPERFTGRDRYRVWLKGRRITKAFRNMLRKQQDAWEHKPLFSIILVLQNSSPEFLSRTIQSVAAQFYPAWELWILHDRPGGDYVKRPDLAPAMKDARVRLLSLDSDGDIARACNTVTKESKGDYIAILGCNDEIAPHALFAVARAIINDPQIDMLYTDEDRISDEGERFDPCFKPGFSQEFLLSSPYTGRLALFRRSLVPELGGFLSDFNLALEYDVALRIAFRAGRVTHIPDILYHRRSETLEDNRAIQEATAEARRRAVQKAIDRLGYKATVSEGALPGTNRIHFEIADQPLVSIVVPSAGKATKSEQHRWLVLDLVESIVEKSTYRNYEIVICDNCSFDPVLTKLLDNHGAKLVRYKKPEFNLADKMNLGVKHARGDYVILLNDDMTVIAPGWIEEMLMWCQQDGIAGVGAKLLYPNGRIQHCGMHLNRFGSGHVFYKCPADDKRLCGSALLVRNYSAVTGACLMVRKHDFLDIGGFDPAYRIDCSDVDFCLRLRDRKGRIVFTPFACLCHFESMSKEPAPPGDFDAFRANWQKALNSDPYGNRQLSADHSRLTVALPPRPLIAEYFGCGESTHSDPRDTGAH